MKKRVGVGEASANALMLTVAIYIGLVASAPPAEAAGSCSTSFGTSYFAGAFGNTASSAWDAVKANIVSRQALLCQPLTGGNFSTAWVMLNNVAGGDGGYSQAGFFSQYITSPAEYFYGEYLMTGTSMFHRVLFPCGTIVGCFAVGSNLTYRVIRLSGDGFVRNETCLLGTTSCDVWQTTTFDPQQRGWISEPEFFGETKDPGDDVPGTKAGKTGWTVNKASVIGSNAWQQINFQPAFAQTTRYHAVFATQDTHLTVWTDPI